MSVTRSDAVRLVPDRPRLLSLPNGEKLAPSRNAGLHRPIIVGTASAIPDCPG